MFRAAEHVKPTLSRHTQAVTGSRRWLCAALYCCCPAPLRVCCPPMPLRLAFAAVFAWIALAAAAQPATVAPNANLRVENIPPIPQALAERVAAYTEFRGVGFADWHPTRREMLVSHRADGANTPQLFLLRAPGGKLEPLTDFAEPIRTGAFDPVAGRFIVYPRDTGGNEATRIYRMDLDTRQHTQLSNPDERSEFLFNHKGDRLLIFSVPLDRTAQGGRRDEIATTLTLLDPLKPESRRTVATLTGSGWFPLLFSPDDRKLLVLRYRSATDSEVWLLDVATGRNERLLPVADGVRAAYGGFAFAPDGKTIYLTTDQQGEFRQLAAFHLATRKLTPLSAHIPWDVEQIALSEDGKRLAAVVNNDGVDELRMFDPASGAELPRPAVPAGAIGNPGWHRSHPRELAFTLNSPQSPGDVQVLDTATGTLTRWAAAAGAIDTHDFAQPEVVRWKSFDGRTISGLLYLPPARFAGPRPVVIAIHGGPEAQATVAFNGRWNYLINELGVALLEPNVRGSRGYGKTFLDLDNGLRREDAVRDIGALLDWIATDPRLDAKRVLVQGGSYGGYMVLASLVHYSDRLRGGIDVVGISDFITFLNNTESYRRELRRSEYGDERDPAMRAYLQKISPLANAERIRAPLFVVHGKNDPRVPVGEAEQIAARVRANGQPVWLLIADNEGHGFARKANADYYFYTLVKFVEDVLLGK